MSFEGTRRVSLLDIESLGCLLDVQVMSGSAGKCTNPESKRDIG